MGMIHLHPALHEWQQTADPASDSAGCRNSQLRLFNINCRQHLAVSYTLSYLMVLEIWKSGNIKHYASMKVCGNQNNAGLYVMQDEGD